MLEIQILRFLLVEKTKREKHLCTVWGLQSKVNHVNKSVHEGEKVVRLLREKYDDVKAFAKELAIEALAQFE